MLVLNSTVKITPTDVDKIRKYSDWQSETPTLPLYPPVLEDMLKHKLDDLGKLFSDKIADVTESLDKFEVRMKKVEKCHDMQESIKKLEWNREVHEGLLDLGKRMQKVEEGRREGDKTLSKRTRGIEGEFNLLTEAVQDLTKTMKTFKGVYGA
jgi:hypothetical protein